MRILVTGAAGFIGSHTANVLTKNKHQVVALDNFSTGKPENLKGFKGRIVPCDITDRKILYTAFSDFNPEAIIHLAAQSAISISNSDPQRDMEVNGVGTLNLLQLAKKFGVKRFVFSSTSAVYREVPSIIGMGEEWPCQPTTPYGISKLACEQYIRTMFPNHMILRYGNVYGPRQVALGENQVIARALAHFMQGDDFKVTGNGNQKRDFVYVEDVAYANFEAVISKVTGTFNVATGKSVSVNRVLSELERIYEVIGYKWIHTSGNDPRGNILMSVSKIKRELGWSARISLSDGLQKTADWWKNRNDKSISSSTRQ